MLEETKKEVREIRSIEAQMKWNMAREEIKNKVEEEREQENEIRDWRWRESDEMRAFVEEQAKITKEVELEESKDFQEFKREVKVVVKEEEQRLITETYEANTDIAAWREEAAQLVVEADKEVIADRNADVHHLREVKAQEKMQEKIEEEERREEEQNLEMMALARQLAREKEQLLESLELTRARQRVPVGNRGAAGRGAPRVGRF